MMPIIVSQANKALLVPDTPGARTLFPSAPLLDSNLVVPHGMRETLLVRHLGYKCPNPVALHYNWCGGKPFAIQQDTVKMLTENAHAYVLNHMGTGKTKTALWAWDFLNKEGLTRRVLVVAPLSTLNFVWAREVFSTLPGRTVRVLHGTRQERLDMLAQDADIYVINHDGVKTIAEALLTRPDITCLILDELAVYRNNSDRSKQMRKFAKKFEIVWGLTGAPMPNEPTDVWGQAQIVTPNTVPKYQSHARDLLMTRINPYIWKPRPNAVELAFQMLQPSVRYALDDVVELPEVISRNIDVDLTPQQKKVYDKVLKELTVMVADQQITVLNAGAAMNKLLQIAGGWVYSINPDFVRLDASNRLAALIDLIRSADQKVLVAVPYRHMIEGIGGVFDRLKVGFDYCTVHGDTTDREAIFHQFQNSDKFHAMLAHPACVHHGLTLTRATRIIWYIPITSLDVYDQFNARITRIGQSHKQEILHLVGTPVERKIYHGLRTHQKLQEQLLGMIEEATQARRDKGK